MPDGTSTPPEVIAEALTTGDITPTELAPEPILFGPPIPEAITDPSANTPETESNTDTLAPEKTENDILQTEAEALIRDIGSKSLQKQIDRWGPIINISSEEQMNKPHLASVRKLATLQFYINEDPGEISETNEKGEEVIGVEVSGKPIIIPNGDKTLSVTRLQALSTNGTAFICQTNELDINGNPLKNPDGSLVINEMQIPRETIINVQIISEQEELRKLLPPEEQLLFDEYVSLLEGNNLPEDISPSDLAKIQKITEDAQESISTTEPNAESMLLLQASNAYYPIGNEAGTVLHYTEAYGDTFTELAKANLKAAEQRKGSALTDFEKKLVQMQSVEEIQQRNKRNQPDTLEMESTYQTWYQNYQQEHGRPPSEEERENYRNTLKFREGNAKDLRILMNKEEMAKLQKTLSKKELAGFIAFMIGMLGTDFVKDFMPQGH